MCRAPHALVLLFTLCWRAQAQSPEQLSEQAQELATQQRIPEAEALWQKAIAASPNYFPALFNLGYTYFKANRFADAEPLLHRAADAAPTDFNARYLDGASLVSLNRPDEALRSWRAALALQPANLRLMQVMSVQYAKGRYFGEAAALANKALTYKADDPNLYFLAIKANQDAGDYAAALEIAKQAIDKFPDSARANFEYAFHLKTDGKIPEALTYLQKAMKDDPTYEEPFFFYGNLLVDQDRSEEAIPYLRKAIEDRHDYVPARVVLARALMNLKKWDESIQELKQTIELDPTHPQPHLLLSQIYFRQGDEAQAKKEKEISFKLRRENPTILEAVQSRPFH
jgi:tetratricopeptide (TPR) repeat protein